MFLLGGRRDSTDGGRHELDFNSDGQVLDPTEERVNNS